MLRLESAPEAKIVPADSLPLRMYVPLMDDGIINPALLVAQALADLGFPFQIKEPEIPNKPPVKPHQLTLSDFEDPKEAETPEPIKVLGIYGFESSELEEALKLPVVRALLIATSGVEMTRLRRPRTQVEDKMQIKWRLSEELTAINEGYRDDDEKRGEIERIFWETYPRIYDTVAAVHEDMIASPINYDELNGESSEAITQKEQEREELIEKKRHGLEATMTREFAPFHPPNLDWETGSRIEALYWKNVIASYDRQITYQSKQRQGSYAGVVEDSYVTGLIKKKDEALNQQMILGVEPISIEEAQNLVEYAIRDALSLQQVEDTLYLAA